MKIDIMNPNIDRKKLCQALSKHFGTESEHQIQESLIKKGILVDLFRYTLQLSRRQRTKRVKRNAINQLIGLGLDVRSQMWIDEKELTKIIGEEKLAEIKKEN